MTRCAYCHHALGDVAVEECPTCHTPHHAECWEENGGCAVAMCDSGPKLPYPSSDPLTAGGRQRVNVALEEGEQGSRERPRSRRRAWKAIVLTIALALVVTGLLIFLFVSQSSGASSRVPERNSVNAAERELGRLPASTSTRWRT